MGAEPSSHILTVARGEYEHEGQMQHLTLRVAKSLGMATPDTGVWCDDDLEVLVMTAARPSNRPMS